ncbi:sulfurtransferase [Gemella sp. GH3]|nr:MULTISPECIES: rhodanese-like domain-containing protein [unclassified Gemella]MBF0713475.1 sulfurtransferase [Gemella sp. GH3.1]NYS50427.1 sulfurtransferase [Gemella sp. GH3]
MINFKKLTPILVAAGLVVTGCSTSSNTTNSNNNDKVEVKEVKTINLTDFENAINKSDYQFVDTRSDDLFNGFTNGEVKYGGHLKNAIQYSSTFVGNVAKDKLKKYVSDKGIDINKKVVLYDTNKENLTKVADEFSKLGYEVFKFEDYKEYANNDNNKENIVSYIHYNTLVSAEWVKKLTSGEKPETYDNNNYKVFEVSWGETDKAKAYNKEHIKGSYHFNTDWIEEGPVWNLQTAEKIKENALKQGITSDTTVVLYSDDASAAFRVNYALKWLGVKDVRILNGGLKSWKDAGGETETKVNTPTEEKEFGIDVPANPEYTIAKAQEMATRAKEEGIKLVSIRSWDEYTGKTSGYDYIERAGEPQGAIYGFSGTSASNMDDYYDPDGTLRNPQEIYNLWALQEISEDDKIALYCGTGWRNGIPWFMTQLTGRANTYFYDGGWNDWQMDSSLPVDINKDKTTKPDAKNDYK